MPDDSDKDGWNRLSEGMSENDLQTFGEIKLLVVLLLLLLLVSCCAPASCPTFKVVVLPTDVDEFWPSSPVGLDPWPRLLLPLGCCFVPHGPVPIVGPAQCVGYLDA